MIAFKQDIFLGRKVSELIFNNPSERGSVVMKPSPKYCCKFDRYIINTEDNPKII
jgi:hypothetical protein